MELTFECIDYCKWFVVFPEYEGPHEDLEMVEGADKMLDALTTDGLSVCLEVEVESPESGNFFKLELEAHDNDGAFYNVRECDKFNGTIWLCNVVHEFFEEHPQIIYCKEI